MLLRSGKQLCWNDPRVEKLEKQRRREEKQRQNEEQPLPQKKLYRVFDDDDNKLDMNTWNARFRPEYREKKEEWYQELSYEYHRQLEESESFDIDLDVVPPLRPGFGFSRTFPIIECTSEKYPLAKCCRAALKHYRRKRPRLQYYYRFKKVAYASCKPCGFYLTCYITYYATKVGRQGASDNNSKSKQYSSTASAGKEVIFQAKVKCSVLRKDSGDPPQVYFCRTKAPPSVKNVRIFGKVVPGSTIQGCAHYLGGREGPSKLEWFGVDTNTGENTLLNTDSAKYTVTEEDVGHSLLFRYTPVNCLGKEGKSKFKRTTPILSASNEGT